MFLSVCEFIYFSIQHLKRMTWLLIYNSAGGPAAVTKPSWTHQAIQSMKTTHTYSHNDRDRACVIPKDSPQSIKKRSISQIKEWVTREPEHLRLELLHHPSCRPLNPSTTAIPLIPEKHFFFPTISVITLLFKRLGSVRFSFFEGN